METKELEQQLKDRVESYALKAEVISPRPFDNNVNLEGFELVKPKHVLTDKEREKEYRELRKKFPSYEVNYWHWYIDERDEDLDFVIQKANEQIDLMRFLKPIKKLYWRVLPEFECIKEFEKRVDIYYVHARFTLGF